MVIFMKGSFSWISCKEMGDTYTKTMAIILDSFRMDRLVGLGSDLTQMALYMRGSLRIIRCTDKEY